MRGCGAQTDPPLRNFVSQVPFAPLSVQEVAMAERSGEEAANEQGLAGAGTFPQHGRQARVVREPSFTPGEMLAYAVILVMVCGPLALGAFGL